ncbi:hypothetical protein MESS2_980070 [Mesorhizobium metallidurans STM 2683]|uniref:Uncharacterized protein n=1 Tax=Mesorhizobium metallidurans STM 2683 TaxID=1297569 RepID=M5EYW9_9HYPH|nr:hypothetical protein MESS2_980070 [Mesorhizobium metallidurans STM 2683]
MARKLAVIIHAHGVRDLAQSLSALSPVPLNEWTVRYGLQGASGTRGGLSGRIGFLFGNVVE